MIYRFTVALCILFLLASCGYHNPYVGEEVTEPKTLYLSIWENRTNEVGLESTLFLSLNQWFKKNKFIHVSQNRETADLILDGRIDSINRPGTSYSKIDQVQEIKAILYTSFSLKKRNGEQEELAWEIKEMPLEKSYVIGTDEQITRDHKGDALAEIVDNLSEYIYHQVLSSGLSEKQD